MIVPRLGLVLGLLASACATHPSSVPLGWGPIAANMKTDPVVAHASKPKPAARNELAAAPESTEEDSDEEVTVTPAETTTEKAEPTEPSRHEAPKSNPNAPLTAAAFAGNYTGEDVSTYRLEGLPERSDRDPNAKINAHSDDEHTASFVLVDSSNGKDICTLTGKTKGNVATLTAGQKCFEQDEGEESATGTLTTGSVTIEDTKLTMDVDFDFKMTVTDRDFSGTLGYHFSGTRK
jgi:hypothetical protein